MAADDAPASGGLELDIVKLESVVWNLLDQGSRHGRDGFHVGTFSAVDDGARAVSRTMVLRQVDPAMRLLAAFSDARTSKIDLLKKNSHANWVFYDARRRLEIRAMGTVTVHTGSDSPLAGHLWRDAQAGAKLGYAGDIPSGQRLAEAPTAVRAPVLADLTPEVADKAFDNFAVLLTHVERLEILHLHHTGHRRACFVYQGKELVDRHWISA